MGSGSPGPARPRVRRTRVRRDPGSGEIPEGVRKRGSTSDPRPARSREPELQSTAGAPEMGSGGPGSDETPEGAQNRSPTPNPEPVQSREPTRITTAGPPERGSRGRSPARRSPNRSRARSRGLVPTRVTSAGPAPSEVPTAKGDILIPSLRGGRTDGHRTQTSGPRSDRNPRPARPRHHDQSQTKEWNLICSSVRTFWFAERCSACPA
ncbi:hypothetical protein BSL78_23351 [Apostichopus japonicus]|uniref:Uncharacterized protein n=1 Tax=Stichopus japonicus TaxID=307972 RepID=A0A2G8JVM5_STIJA|nr:hypothetical protein BSL78_23351 [Apostichopus japonicus]